MARTRLPVLLGGFAAIMFVTFWLYGQTSPLADDHGPSATASSRPHRFTQLDTDRGGSRRKLDQSTTTTTTKTKLRASGGDDGVRRHHSPIYNEIDEDPFAYNATAALAHVSDTSNMHRPCGAHINKNIHYVDRPFWQSIKPQTMFEKRRDWEAFLTKEIEEKFNDYEKYGFHGRGIVYTASGRTLARALASIKILRKQHGVQLPIQVWYIGDELSKEDKAKLAAVPNVFAKDILVEQKRHKEFSDFHISHQYGSGRNYHIKTLVLLLSEFEELLYLDSDNFALRNPEYLFNAKEYEDTGAIFWPDYWKFPADQPLWQIAGRQCEDEWEQESGQLVIDKRRAFRPLLLSMFFQRDHDFYFKIILGDKDTFRFAWKLSGTPYHMIKHPVGSAGRTRQGRFCGHTMVQFDMDGQVLFAHTSALKTTNAINKGITWETVQYFTPASAVDISDASNVDRPNKRLFRVGYPVAHEWVGGAERSKEDGGVGKETALNPCLSLAVEQVTFETTTEVINSLGAAAAIDSYRIVTEPWTSHNNGALMWFESAYYDFGGPGSALIDGMCGNGVVGDGRCPNPDECCSAWGWCGITADHCGLGCSGGPCYKSRTLPAKPHSNFAFCGNGKIGFGLCSEPDKECCSRFGWCGTSDGHCNVDVCLSGPCRKRDG